MVKFQPNNIPNKVGIGLRAQHYQEVINKKPDVNWFEVHSENFFADGGIATDVLERVRKEYPLSLHGVGLSIGTTDKLDEEHLRKLKLVVDHFNPDLVSEHVAWSVVEGDFMNDLLPLPYNSESVNNIVNNIQQTQEYIGRKILIENPSTYLEFKESDMSEADFMVDVAKKAGCGILLDINNIYVVTQNHGHDPIKYINSIPPELVGEMHLAGHEVRKLDADQILIDTHGDFVIDDVWKLYEHAVKHLGAKPTLMEWDTNIPAFSILEGEAKKATKIMDEVLDGKS